MMKGLLFFVFMALFILPAYAQVKKVSAKPAVKPKTAAVAKAPATATEPWKQLNTKERLVEITTEQGTMIARLYDNTPLHRDNFVKLVKEGFYDSLLFHRAIAQFMIQGGDPNSKNAPDGVALGSGSASGERIPAEFRPNLFHKKGALAAARDNNPERASSNCQFYIVHGKRLNEQELEQQLARVRGANPAFSYTATQKEIYNRMGGTPGLDQNYTVFGEVISGLDVIDKIANVQKNQSDRPLQNVRMKMRMLN